MQDWQGFRTTENLHLRNIHRPHVHAERGLRFATRSSIAVEASLPAPQLLRKMKLRGWFKPSEHPSSASLSCILPHFQASLVQPGRGIFVEPALTCNDSIR